MWESSSEAESGLREIFDEVRTVKGKDNAPEERTNSSFELGVKPEAKYLDERFNQFGHVEVVERGTPTHLEGSKEKFDDYALVHKIVHKRDSTIRTHSVRINSPHILQTLREVVWVYPTQPAGFKLPITDEAPFALFYHNKTKIESYGPQGEVAKSHHGLLLKWMNWALGGNLANVEKLIQKNYITFDFLWSIFKPGELQYATHRGHPRLYMLDKADYKATLERGSYFELNCSYVEFNGSHIGKATESMEIFERFHFTGKSPSRISALMIFPRKFVEDDGLEAKLRVRGTRLLGLKGIHIAGRVVIDQKTFREDFTDQGDYCLTEGEDGSLICQLEEDWGYSMDNPCSKVENLHDQSQVMTRQEIDYADPMLCPPFAIGFSLDRKAWCRLFVDQLMSIDWQQNPMDRLILPNTHKRILSALMRSHRFPEQARDEWESKGKGLVLLLHGTPGSGKTMTAETCAEYTKKALFKISLSELKDGQRLEAAMLQFQRYASTWKAIMLIDEADVFLEARSNEGSESADRNGLVAVFLRTLEYFHGIIFLTSNRVDIFDQAIKSRVHIALEYKSPDIASRRCMWQNSLSALPDSACGFVDKSLEEVLDVVEKAEMNGREISNGIHTALTLARDEKQKVGREHLETIVEVWKQFGIQLANGAVHTTDGLRLDTKKEENV